jgi:hypothetical protein
MGAFHKKTISGYINVSASKYSNLRQITSNSNFFDGAEEFIIKETENSFTITLATICYQGKTYRKVPGRYGWIAFTCISNLPLGRYEFDQEESSEDCVVIYYQEQIKTKL